MYLIYKIKLKFYFLFFYNTQNTFLMVSGFKISLEEKVDPLVKPMEAIKLKKELKLEGMEEKKMEGDKHEIFKPSEEPGEGSEKSRSHQIPQAKFIPNKPKTKIPSNQSQPKKP